MVADESRPVGPSAKDITYFQDVTDDRVIPDIAAETPLFTGVLAWLKGSLLLVTGGWLGQDLIRFCDVGEAGPTVGGDDIESNGELQRQRQAAQDCIFADPERIARGWYSGESSQDWQCESSQSW